MRNTLRLAAAAIIATAWAPLALAQSGSAAGGGSDHMADQLNAQELQKTAPTSGQYGDGYGGQGYGNEGDRGGQAHPPAGSPPPGYAPPPGYPYPPAYYGYYAPPPYPYPVYVGRPWWYRPWWWGRPYYWGPYRWHYWWR